MEDTHSEVVVIVKPETDAVGIESAAANSRPTFRQYELESSSMLQGFSGPDDALDPMNWSNLRKLAVVLSLCSLAFSSSFASSVFAPATTSVAEHFHVSQTVANLGVSLFVLGFAAGPLAFGPLSEEFGRRWPLMTALLLLAVFQIPVAVAHNIGTVLAFRLLSGVTGSAAISIPPAVAVDILTPAQRLFCVNFYMAFTLGGTVVGPIAGTFITVRYGWRWTAWTTLILVGVMGLLAFFAIPESCAEVLLQKKAARLRKTTGNTQLHAQRDISPITFHVLMSKYMTKAARMLILEPILLTMTLYSALVFGLLYLLFFSIPYTYIKTRRWSAESSSLPFVGMLVGVLFGSATTLIGDLTWWLRRFRARGHKFLPEDRLLNLMLSAVLLPAGLLWMAWTSTKSVPWAAQVCAGVLVGVGVELNLYSTTAYFIDVYQLHSNSAIGGYICVRSAVAFAFPLFANQMFEHLGVEWATTLLALLCTALAPLPFLFWRYGRRIRSWSRYSFDG